MKAIVVILGSPNDEYGNLSDIALGRLDKGIEEYRSNLEYKILCTGGFGDFNKTNPPHAEYAIRYLKGQSIPDDDILEIAESKDTKDDAIKAKLIIDSYSVKDLIIVTSDFHMDRVRLIFESYFAGYSITYVAAKTNFSKQTYEELLAHEKREIEKLQKSAA